MVRPQAVITLNVTVRTRCEVLRSDSIANM